MPVTRIVEIFVEVILSVVVVVVGGKTVIVVVLVTGFKVTVLVEVTS